MAVRGHDVIDGDSESFVSCGRGTAWNGPPLSCSGEWRSEVVGRSGPGVDGLGESRGRWEAWQAERYRNDVFNQYIQ